MSKLHRLQLIYGAMMMLLLVALVSLPVTGNSNSALASNERSVLGSAGLLGPEQVGVEANAPDCDPNWTVVPSPNVGTGNSLTGVAAVSSNDVWAVGWSRNVDPRVTRTLIEHWNGSAWSVVPSPNVNTGYNRLEAVVAVSSNDVWAVGWHDAVEVNRAYTLILHWDGSAWSVVPSPSPGALYNSLWAVSAVSSNDVWAVGSLNNGNGGSRGTLAMHWNGSAWSVVPSPSRGTLHNGFAGVAAVGPNDVWAVGASYTVNGPETLIEHWNGSAWSVVPSPNPSIDSLLNAVVAVGPNDVWAVGYTGDDSSSQTLIEHWNGSAWSVVPSPSSGDDNLLGVSAVGPNDVWAVGHSGTNSLVEHWNGSAWSVVPSPNGGSGNNLLTGVDMLSSSDVWAVGVHGTYPAYQTLVERYNPCTGSPTPTATPGGATATPTSPVVATATPVPCTPGSFTDMPPDNPFYPYVTCLVNRGIISGYADCTFRPNNQVTRSQLAKIVSNAAGFQEDPGAQIFEDVASDNTFYQWINRLSRRGFMGGYTCGGPGEPCVNGNRPYFRPGANATRGQTSKIVANAAGYIEEPSGQTFEDVPPTHTFYREIQRLAVRNIMGGYPCGGNGEPCLSGKPYFRPQNNVTRGQSAKIVANTFYPNCQTSGGR